MASRGARNLILLSRSGPRSGAAQEAIKRLEAANVRVFAPSCSVSDRDALQQALKDCATIMPPIKGCIQASGVLKVSERSYKRLARAATNMHSAGCHVRGYDV